MAETKNNIKMKKTKKKTNIRGRKCRSNEVPQTSTMA
jgi:hypothetical protein